MQLTEDQTKFASQIAGEAECFVVAHEIGHALTQMSPIRGEKGDEIQLAWLQGIGPNHTGEHHADLIGLTILLGMYTDGRRLTLDMSLSYAGAEFLLQIFRVLKCSGLNSPKRIRLPAIA